MTSMTNTTAITNEQISRDIKLSESMVSRIRSGDRMPSFATMQLIEQIYMWSLEDQARARRNNIYHTTFEYRINQHYVR